MVLAVDVQISLSALIRNDRSLAFQFVPPTFLAQTDQFEVIYPLAEEASEAEPRKPL